MTPQRHPRRRTCVDLATARVLAGCALLVALLLAIFPAAAAGQDTDATEMRRWLRAQRQQYRDFVTEQDRQFAAFLSEAWQAFSVSQGRVRDTEPKPSEAPRASAPEVPEPSAPIPAPIEPPASPAVPPSPQVPPDLQPPAPWPGLQRLTVTFLGLDYSLPLDTRLRRLPRQQPGSEPAARAWLALSQADSKPLLQALADAHHHNQLGDWGLFLLTETVALACYPDDRSRGALLHWFLALRLGLDVRLAFAEAGYVVIYACSTAVFQAPFLVRGETPYYLHDPGQRFSIAMTLRSHDAQLAGDLRPLHVDLSRLPRTEPEPVTRLLDWSLGGEARQTAVVTDRQLVRFLGTVPQVALQSHFASVLSPLAAGSLQEALAADLAARDAVDRVRLLLHLVQTALPYATDADQFGEEDYLYPDETLFYPASDCEDRSVLLAALVRLLVDLPVVGLDYPGHIALAVALPDAVPGDAFTWRETVYTVCDPTYIGAALGQTMPRYRGERPRLILAGD